MVVAVAGGHGKIGMHLTKALAERGDRVLSLIRDPAQAGDVEAVGGEPVVADLEASHTAKLVGKLAGAGALVFAAGAGPGSGAERKRTMDLGGALLLLDAAQIAGIGRFVMVSAISADPDHPGDDVFDVYLRAKGEADVAVAGSGLDYTIVRPGRLTDEPGTGRVRLGESVPRGEISREDVAAVLAAALKEPATIGRTFELVGGEEPIPSALAKLAG